MYLTKFPINVTRRETRHMLASPYRLHAAIEGSLAPAARVSDEGRTLWRVDRNRDNTTTLYIVSTTIPSLIGLDEQIGWPDLDQQWKTRVYDPFLDSLEEGQRYRFRLVANPVVSRRSVTNGADHSKRMPHVTVLQQMSWLVGRDAYEDADRQIADRAAYLLREKQSRAQANGFDVVRDAAADSLLLTVSDTQQLEFRQGKAGNRISLATARYDGLLEVRDPARLRHALTHGIGKAKGFGCGLLTLSAAKS